MGRRLGVPWSDYRVRIRWSFDPAVERSPTIRRTPTAKATGGRARWGHHGARGAGECRPLGAWLRGRTFLANSQQPCLRAVCVAREWPARLPPVPVGLGDRSRPPGRGWRSEQCSHPGSVGDRASGLFDVPPAAHLPWRPGHVHGHGRRPHRHPHFLGASWRAVRVPAQVREHYRWLRPERGFG